jgi:hypothetical protein
MNPANFSSVVILRLGFTPGWVGMIKPSIIYVGIGMYLEVIVHSLFRNPTLFADPFPFYFDPASTMSAAGAHWPRPIDGIHSERRLAGGTMGRQDRIEGHRSLRTGGRLGCL